MIKKLKRMIILLLPKNLFFDRVVAYCYFCFAHKRLPKKGYFSEEFLRIKTSKEILNPLRQFTSDKELVKIFIKGVIGDKFNVPTLKILYNKDQINNYNFPDNCCIKPTHASGKFLIHKNGIPNRDEISAWLDLDYYAVSREGNYKHLIPKVIVEPLIFNSDNILDFKFFCKFGEVKFIQVDVDRINDHKRKFYNSSWSELDFSISYQRSNQVFPKPECLNEMIEAAKSLSSFFNVARIDFYTNNKVFYVGEITHCPESSNGRVIPNDKEEYVTKLFK